MNAALNLRIHKPWGLVSKGVEYWKGSRDVLYKFDSKQNKGRIELYFLRIPGRVKVLQGRISRVKVKVTIVFNNEKETIFPKSR